MAKNIEPKVSEYSFVQVLLRFNDSAKLFLVNDLHQLIAEEITENE